MPTWISRKVEFNVTETGVDYLVISNISLNEFSYLIVLVDTSNVLEYYPIPPVLKIVISTEDGRKLEYSVPLWRADSITLNFTEPIPIPPRATVSIYINTPYPLSGVLYMNIFNTFNFVCIPVGVGTDV